MSRKIKRYWAFGMVLAVVLVPYIAYGADKEKSSGVTTGVDVLFPEPKYTLLPTINTAPASFWPEGVTPIALPGFAVNAFAKGLQHPRWLFVLPNGDVLVAETGAPSKEKVGISEIIVNFVKKRVGAGEKSTDKIILLRDLDNDGIAETRSVFLTGLKSPFGMALIDDTLYIANTDSIVKVPYRVGTTKITTTPIKVVDLPAGSINSHWTKSLLASPDSSKLFVGVGSNSNVAERGIEVEKNRAAILEIDLITENTRIFASGLRNPVGMDWQPDSGALWVVVNERDGIGMDVPPDYLTSVREGAFYGWPYSYFGAHVDKRVKPQRPDLVAKAVVPDYALGGHVAPLGLAFYKGNLFPKKYHGGAFIGEHGSWNRKPFSGYQVVFVPFVDGKPSGQARTVLRDFLNSDDEAQGRPAGIAIDQHGAVLVADDVGNTVWRVIPSEISSE